MCRAACDDEEEEEERTVVVENSEFIYSPDWFYRYMGMCANLFIDYLQSEKKKIFVISFEPAKLCDEALI